MKTPILIALVALVSGTAIAETFVYFGTYTRGESEGIYRSTMDPETGELSDPELAAEVVNPSFVAVHPDSTTLYAVSEIKEFEGREEGVVSAYAIGEKGELTLLNRLGTGGSGPCHVSLDAAGRTVLVANYSGGSVASFPVKSDGSLGERTALHAHAGRGGPGKEEAKPLAHSIMPHPSGARACSADKGLDAVLIYELNGESGKLSVNDPPMARLPDGTAPRHVTFHPSQPFAYVNLERTLELAALRYDDATGNLELIEIESTLDPGAEAKGSTAEALVHPSGKWVYVSNRGPNSIAVFAIDPASGEITPVERESTRGEIPRNFGITPDGKFVVAANQKTNNVAVLRVDEKTGALEPTGHGLEVPSPVCVRFVER